MIDKKSILKMVRDVANRSHGISSRKTTNPHREWFLGVVAFLVVAVTGSVLNAWIHVGFYSVEPQIEKNSQTVTIYKQSIVDDALIIFGEREKAFTSFETKLIRQPVIVTMPTSTNPTNNEDEEENKSEAF